MAELVKARDGKGKDIASTAVNDDGTVTVTLAYPIKVMNEEKTSLVMKRPKGKQLRAMDNATGTVSASLSLIQKLTNIPEPSVDALDALDIGTMGRVIEGFTRLSLPTGED